MGDGLVVPNYYKATGSKAGGYNVQKHTKVPLQIRY